MGSRGLLLDRDGVINVDHGYIGQIERFDFMPGLFPFLRQALDAGYRLAIITNQSGVARGYYTAQDHFKLMDWALAHLRDEGITIELVLECFEYPDGIVDAYSRESFWRKPNPGMVMQAVQQLHLDPARSVFLGDNLTDMDAAAGGKIGTRLLIGEQPPPTLPQGVQFVRNHEDAWQIIKAV